MIANLAFSHGAEIVKKSRGEEILGNRRGIVGYTPIINEDSSRIVKIEPEKQVCSGL